MKHKFWESYFDENSLQDEISQGVIQAHFYCPAQDKPAVFAENALVLLTELFGELSNSGVYSEDIPRAKRFLYNAGAFGEESRLTHDPETVLPTGTDLMKRTVERIYRVEFIQVEAGLGAGWSNPYVNNGDIYRWSMNAIIEKMPKYYVVKLAFGKASMWFSKYARPLFSSDSFVKQHPEFEWNKNPKGVIVPKETHLHYNRKRLATMLVTLSNRLEARAAFSGYLSMRYDWNHNTCYVRKMYDTPNDLSIIHYYYLPADGTFSTGDLEDFTTTKYHSVEFKGHPHYFDFQHFDQLNSADLEG